MGEKLRNLTITRIIHCVQLIPAPNTRSQTILRSTIGTYSFWCVPKHHSLEVNFTYQNFIDRYGIEPA